MPRCHRASSQRISHSEIGISHLKIGLGLGLELEQLAHVLELGLAPHRRLYKDLVRVRLRVRVRVGLGLGLGQGWG